MVSAATPIESYYRDLKRADFTADPSQKKGVELLQNIYEELIHHDRPGSGIFRGLFKRGDHKTTTKGLYLWGGVGRGKTYVVDQFYDCLQFEEKKRIHFHRFMRKVHSRLKELRHLQNPLAIVGADFARDFRVLCLDEFIVNDITDAMILSALLKHLFDNSVTLIATSNIAPDDLYKDGLQRDRFQPAIGLLNEYTTVYQLDGGLDYRLQYLDQAEIYFHPHNASAQSGLEKNFEHIASEAPDVGTTLEIDGREIHALHHVTGIVWFDFGEICGGPRSQNDYLELARCFHTIVVSDIPALSAKVDDQARRFINLIDILYDRNVKFMGSGCCPPEVLYQGHRLRMEFNRTASRLTEMQSTSYLARPHLS